MVRLEEDDFLRFTVLDLFHQLSNSLLMKLSLALLLLAWILSYIFVKPFSIQNSEVLLLLALTVYVILFIPAYKLANAKVRFGEMRHLRGETLWTFSNKGFIMQSESSAAQNNWSLVSEVIESADDFYLYQINDLAYDIPKFAFDTPQALEDFKDILRTNLGAKAKLSK